MDATLRKIYRQVFLDRIEEPIRGVISLLWDLLFVEDTGHTCSGHTVQLGCCGGNETTCLIPDNLNKGIYNPKPAIIEVFYSFESGLSQLNSKRDAFRQELRDVKAQIGDKQIYFIQPPQTSNYIFEDPYNYVPKLTLREILTTNIPPVDMVNKSIPDIQATEQVLAQFWQGVYRVIRKYHPSPDNIKEEIDIPLKFRAIRGTRYWREIDLFRLIHTDGTRANLKYLKG